MPYSVQIISSAQKEIKKLEANIRQKVVEKIHALAADPRPVGVLKLQSRVEKYRIRLGDFRIVYQINDASLIVLVIKVGDRKDVYD